MLIASSYLAWNDGFPVAMRWANIDRVEVVPIYISKTLQHMLNKKNKTVRDIKFGVVPLPPGHDMAVAKKQRDDRRSSIRRAREIEGKGRTQAIPTAFEMGKRR